MTLIDLVVGVLATYRLARLATRDEITRRPRNRIIRWAYRHRTDEVVPEPCPGQDLTVDVMDDPEPQRVAYLASCLWCSSGWLGLVVAGAMADTSSGWVDWPVRGLAFSTAAGMLARFDS